MFSGLITFFLLVNSGHVALSSCVARPQKTTEGKFKVTSTEKVVFHCLNETSTEITGKMSTPFCKVDAIAENGKKKYDSIFVGEKGCAFKVGETVSVKLIENFSCCNHDLKFACNSGSDYQFNQAKDNKSVVECKSSSSWIWADWNSNKPSSDYFVTCAIN